MASARPLIAATRLRERLNYDPETGVFTWKAGNNQVKAGRVAGTPDWADGGYLKIMVDRRTYSAHRLAWLYAYGEWPKQTIDHINGVRGDNRIANLRDIPIEVNVSLGKRKGGGHLLGAYKHGSRFRAGRCGKYLGTFDTAEEAHAAYRADEVRALAASGNGETNPAIPAASREKL